MMKRAKQYIELVDLNPLNLVQKMFYFGLGGLLSILLVPVEIITGIYGRKVRLSLINLALKNIHRVFIEPKLVYELIFRPMDTTRYLEFQYGYKWTSRIGRINKYMDVSSPRFFPALILNKLKPESLIINPDKPDLNVTKRLMSFLSVNKNCTFSSDVIQQHEQTVRFDFISCVSVLEHIPEDGAALSSMWDALEEGGHLYLTIPCARDCYKQYISQDQFGVLKQEEDGYTFWQKFYDRDEIERQIFSICGEPEKSVIYGEYQKGSFFRNATLKRMTRFYPFWLEGLRFKAMFRKYNRVDELPGEGVAIFLFRKKST